MKKNKRAIAPLKFRTPDPEEETMTPFFVFFMIPFSLTFIIPHLNSGRNLDAAEIHGENMVSLLIPYKNIIYAQRRGVGKDF